MIAFREWRLEYWRGDRPRPVLRSVVMRRAWRYAEAKADGRPGMENDRGLYGVLSGDGWEGRLIRLGDCTVVAEGAVDLHGRVVVHEDDVARGERARILALRVLPCRLEEHCGFAYFLAPWRDMRRRLGLVAYCDCARGGPELHDITLEELEQELLRAYGVPRLPRPAPIRARRS